MHTVSQTYKDILKTKYHVDTALLIGGSGVVKNSYTDDELDGLLASDTSVHKYGLDYIKSISTSGSTFTNEEPAIGCCVSRRIDMTIRKPSEAIPRCARLVPIVRLYNDKGQKSEWIPKGVFFVDSRKESVSRYREDEDPNSGQRATLLEIKGYDSMLRAEMTYDTSVMPYAPMESESEEEEPVSTAGDLNVVKVCAELLTGIAWNTSVDARTIEAISSNFAIPVLDDYSVREALGFIAALYAGNFVFSDCGKLQFIPLIGEVNRNA